MTPRLTTILKASGDYYTLTRAMTQDVCGEKNDRVMRKHLQQLVAAGYLAKTRMQVVSSMGAAAPVYYLTRKGAEWLAAEVDRKYLHCCTLCPNWQHLLHWTAVSQFKIVIDRGAALQTGVSIRDWLGEWDVVNPEAKEPEEKFRLFTLLKKEPRLVCNPDAGFVLSMNAKTTEGRIDIAHYLEFDRETSAINQIAASKSPGYAELLKQNGHDRHFDNNVEEFRVLSVSLTPGRRDLLRAAFKGKQGAKLWKFASWTEFLPETALFEAIWYPVEGDPTPLVRRAAIERGAILVGSAAGSAR